MTSTEVEARLTELEEAMTAVIEDIGDLRRLFRKIVGEGDELEVFPIADKLVWLRGEVTELRLQLDAQ